MKHSLKTGSPFVFINDSGGARVQEGIDALSGYGKVFYTNVMLSGAVPQISLICGPCAGGAAYSPALTDFIIQTRQAQMFITGPQVIKGVTGEDVTAEELGGADSHMTRSGVIHFIANDDRHAAQLCQKLLSFLPSNNLEDPPQVEGDRNVDADEEIGEIVPADNKKSYDIRNIITRLVDFGDFLEVQQGYAPNIVVGFARITGRSIGIIANQPSILAGSLDINASSKAARFIRFCNAFNIPLVTLADVPGFLPGTEQEYGGIIRHGAKMLFAYSAATVPKITVILRKAYGGAYIAMCSKDLGADRVFAWPTAEVAVMGAEGAAEIVFRKEIQEAKDKKAKRPRWSRCIAKPSPTPTSRPAAVWSMPSSIRPDASPRIPGARVPANQARTPSAEKARADATLRGNVTAIEVMETKMNGPVPHSDAEALRATLEEIRSQLATLAERVNGLERLITPATPESAPASLAPAPEPAASATPATNSSVSAEAGISEEEILAISAALAAWLGVQPHIRQIRLIRTSAWAQQGRVTIQASHGLHY